jgi:hypothetical protein
MSRSPPIGAEPLGEGVSMSVDIPQPFRARVEGPIGVTVDGIDIPQPFRFTVDSLPKIVVGVDPLTVNPLTINPLSVGITELPKISIGLDPLTINPVDVSIGITRIPDVRAHLPADFRLGLSILGKELCGIRLTGEAQVITEPFEPNPCEEHVKPPPPIVLQPLPAADGDG